MSWSGAPLPVDVEFVQAILVEIVYEVQPRDLAVLPLFVAPDPLGQVDLSRVRQIGAGHQLVQLRVGQVVAECIAGCVDDA